MLSVSGVCLFDVGDITFDTELNQYCFQAYDVNTGLLSYTARCSKALYDLHFDNLGKRPYHLYFHAKLVDVPMLMDYVGPIPEARQRLDIVDCMVLPSDVHVPQGFVNRARVTMLPYTFEPGPKAGYYLIKMNGESRLVVESRQEEEALQNPDDEDDDFDLGLDDLEEVTEPTLSMFDADVLAQSEQSAAKSSVSLALLAKQGRAKRVIAAEAERASSSKSQSVDTTQSEAQRTTAPSLLSKAAATSMSAKKAKAGKQRVTALPIVSVESQPSATPSMSAKRAGKQPATDLPIASVELQPSSSVTTGQSTTSGSSDTQPDYLGLYEESGGKHTVLKRPRTRDTQSTTSKQDRKKSKTLEYLKKLQERSKK